MSTFVASSTLEELPEHTSQSINDLDFGAVKVDDEGFIELYNEYESNLSGVEIAAAEGRNFFTQLAPCTNNDLVYGTFKEGVSDDDLDTAFPYTFSYKMQPTLVDIQMYRHPEDKSNWIFVKKK